MRKQFCRKAVFETCTVWVMADEGFSLCFAAALHPLLIVRYKDGRGHILGMSQEAEAAGAQVGMRMYGAKALCPDVQFVLVAPGRMWQVLEQLQLSLTRYSQWVEAARDQVQTAILYIDLGKLRPKDGQQVVDQFGKPGGHCHRLALGKDARQVPRYKPSVVECAVRQFDPPLDNRHLRIVDNAKGHIDITCHCFALLFARS